MCGIAGFSGNFDKTLLKLMNAVQAHRGPDDSGIWLNNSNTVGLAHRRLSIIDLTAEGRQPMSNIHKTVTIVFNGEIYNYKELRREILSKGYIFKSKSDTEVLIHLYDELGHKMLDRLNGIFSFAIWDNRKKELFVARDGLGVKPLYYASTKKGFLFGSELKAILQEKEIDKTINFEAIHYYMFYLWSPAPHTMLKSVYKLEPGHALIVKNGKVKKKWCFYDLPYCRETLILSEKDIARVLAEKIKDAVYRQMISDVPLGAFLSGGLDSTSVVTFAKKFNPDQKIDCFTIDFKNNHKNNEGFAEDLPYAKSVAKLFNIPLHTIMVGPEMVKRIGEMLYFLDEPQADPAPLNALFICELAKEHGFKVLLSGAGGDDIFSGYRRHYALLLEKYWAWLPEKGRKILCAISHMLPQNSTSGRRIAKAFKYAHCNGEERLIQYFSWIDENILRSLYTEELKFALAYTRAIEPLKQTLCNIPNESKKLNRMLYLEAKHFLADHNLNYTDKMGMAAGVEVRVPLLDIELINFVTRIPTDLKQKGKIGKYIFKKAMEPYLPREIIYRPKTGFGAPLRQWLHGELREVVMDMLGEKSLKKRGIFDPKAVRKLIDDYYTRKIDASYSIFSMMCIEWWQRIFLDENQP